MGVICMEYLSACPANGGGNEEIAGQNTTWFDLSPDGSQLVDLNGSEDGTDGKKGPVVHLVDTRDWKEVAKLPLGKMSTPRPWCDSCRMGKEPCFRRRQEERRIFG